MTKQTFHFIFLLAVGMLFTQCSGDTKAKAFLEIQAKAVNLQCPMKVDYMTTLDKCEVVDNRTFRYLYTVSGEVDTAKVAETLRPNMVNLLKTMPEIQKFRDYEVNIEYVYNNPKGDKLFQINISPDEYK